MMSIGIVAGEDINEGVRLVYSKWEMFVRGVDIGMLVMLSNEHVGVGKDLISSYRIACLKI